MANYWVECGREVHLPREASKREREHFAHRGIIVDNENTLHFVATTLSLDPADRSSRMGSNTSNVVPDPEVLTTSIRP